MGICPYKGLKWLKLGYDITAGGILTRVLKITTKSLVYIVIVIVITTYHAVYWCYRASRADRWFLPRSIPWVPGLPEVAHSMTEDPEDRGYRPTRLWGQWQLQSVSISNGDGRWPVCSPGVKGQGTATQQHSNKQKARASPMGAKQQPRYKAARMRRSKSGPLVVRVRHLGDDHHP